MSDEVLPPQKETHPGSPERALIERAIEDPTPIEISRRTRNLMIIGFIIALVFLIREAPTILTISLGGGYLALILSFPVRLLSRFLSRGLSILLTLLILFGSIAVAIFIVVPLMITELSGLVDAIPDMAEEGEGWLREMLRPLQEKDMVSDDTDSVLEDLQQSIIERASTIAEGLLDDVLAAITGIFDLAVKTFGIVFVAIYLLADTRRIKAAYLRVAPEAYRKDALMLWDDFGVSLSRYLGGLSISLILQGALSCLALWAIGVPYPLLLGFWVSLTAVIPYLGAFLGAVPAVLLGFYVSPTTGVLTIVIYIVIQQLEGNVLTPRIQGQAVRVHPIIVLLAVIAGSEIDGLRGAIFAVPTLAVLRVLLDFMSARLRVQADQG